MTTDLTALTHTVEVARRRLEPLYSQIGRVIVGQRMLLDRLLIALLTGGHILLEGVPGLAKTLTVRTLARALHLTFNRIQFTPDLLPADVIGTQIYSPRTTEFTVKKGPIFANLVLADEINRAPAKVQSALLEAMQEKQVTIGESTFPLEEPFLVLATQNPIEQEGTYPLPEAQLDRFMFKHELTYPDRDEELLILDRMSAVEPVLYVDAALNPAELFELRKVLDQVHIDARLKGYIVDLVRATRKPSALGLDLESFIHFGASPRASIFLARAARGEAFLHGRAYVTPQDIKSIALDVLRHRIGVTYEAEAEELTTAAILQRILDHLPVP